MDQFDEEKKKQIEFYLQKLQTKLTQFISDSHEMAELKKLVSSEEQDVQFCIFSLMMDKETAESMRHMDMELFQRILMEVQAQGSSLKPLGEDKWTDDDQNFLKSLKIIL